MSGLQLVGVVAKRLLRSDGGGGHGAVGFTHAGGIGAAAGEAGSGQRHEPACRLCRRLFLAILRAGKTRAIAYQFVVVVFVHIYPRRGAV